MKPYFAVDLDGPVFDYFGRMCEIFGYTEYYPWKLEEKWPEFAECVKMLTKHPPFYWYLPVMPGASIYLGLLTTNYQIVGITARPYSKEMEMVTKYSLSLNALPIREFVFATNKRDTLIKYKPAFFVDDNPIHLREASDLGIGLFLWDMPYNKNEFGFYKVNDWKTIYHIAMNYK